jgi:hypothetical protein
MELQEELGCLVMFIKQLFGTQQTATHIMEKYIFQSR